MTLREYFLRQGLDVEQDAIDRALSTLEARDAYVLGNRFGARPLTLKDVGATMGVCGQRVRQLEARGLRRVRAALLSEQAEGRSIQDARAYAFEHLSNRAWNALHNAHILTIEELAARTREDALKLKGLGRETLLELDTLLARYGMQWRDPVLVRQLRLECGCLVKDDRRREVWLLSVTPCEIHRNAPGAPLAEATYQWAKAAIG